MECPHRDRRAARRGAVTIWLVFSCGLLLALFALAVNYTRLWNTRVELQNDADAAVLASAAALVGDDLLRGDPAYLPGLLQHSAADGQRFAQLNLVQGQPFNLEPRDLVFGTLDTPRNRNLVLAEDVRNPTNASLALINTVRVRARLTQERGNAPGVVFGQFLGLGSVDVQAEAAAMLDRDVIGFRPLGDQSIPLAPFALYSDPSGKDPKSWQYQVELQNGTDVYRYDRFMHAFVSDPSGDGLFEMQAVLALNSDQTALSNVALLYLGVNNIAGISQQLLSGVTADQLTGFGGRLLLDKLDNRLSVPGTNQGPAEGSADATTLVQSLQQIQALAQPLVWPLYCSLDSNNQPILCGFVAARIATVTPPSGSDLPLTFVLQPTMVSNVGAITDAGQRGIGGIAITNPYICKVRLVE